MGRTCCISALISEMFPVVSSHEVCYLLSSLVCRSLNILSITLVVYNEGVVLYLITLLFYTIEGLEVHNEAYP